MAIDDENVLGITKEILTLYPDGTGNLYFVSEMLETSNNTILWADGKIKFEGLGLVWNYTVNGNQIVATGTGVVPKRKRCTLKKPKE